jgi:hypothetical protein
MMHQYIVISICCKVKQKISLLPTIFISRWKVFSLTILLFLFMCTYFSTWGKMPIDIEKGINVGIGNHFMLGDWYFVKSYANNACANWQNIESTPKSKSRYPTIRNQCCDCFDKSKVGKYTTYAINNYLASSNFHS